MLATCLVPGLASGQTRQARASLEVRATVVRACTVGTGVTIVSGCEALVREDVLPLRQASTSTATVREVVTESAVGPTAAYIVVRTVDF